MKKINVTETNIQASATNGALRTSSGQESLIAIDLPRPLEAPGLSYGANSTQTEPKPLPSAIETEQRLPGPTSVPYVNLGQEISESMSSLNDTKRYLLERMREKELHDKHFAVVEYAKQIINAERMRLDIMKFLKRFD